MSTTVTIDLRQVARGLELTDAQIQATVELLEEGNTIPFITRYRKDRTGGLDEEQIRLVQDRLAKTRQLAERKQTILRSIESQGKLSESLTKQILAATTMKRLEDLYLPFKPKKQTLATTAQPRPGRVGEGNLRGESLVRETGRPRRRLRQHGPPGSHRGRRLAGRGPYPRRAILGKSRSAAATAGHHAAHRRDRQRANRP